MQGDARPPWVIWLDRLLSSLLRTGLVALCGTVGWVVGEGQEAPRLGLAIGLVVGLLVALATRGRPQAAWTGLATAALLSLFGC